ncbi:GTPase activator [Desmophyllum pertusum]|uniref:GTPase activator n=1 Tax=Desmophyllum pertusum TaxID=174260 RepID=A0A9X0CVF6_9CNID|nr:GTPase activator [Desmophyllum pertusum]
MKSNVPVKRRRWRMRVFADVFVASEALDWLHGFLKENPNFGPDVTRQQAVQLCQKFLKNGIITDARGAQYNGMFENNSHLYRFTDKARYSPYKISRPPRNEKHLAQKAEDVQDKPAAHKITTPSVKDRHNYNLRSTPFTAGPSRTPLVNKLNVLSSSTRTDPTRGPVKRAVKRRRSSRHSSDLKEVIMNPAAFVAHNRRSLTDKEISEVWWNIATIRLRMLMDLDDSFVNSLKVEGYDTSCVWHSSQAQRIPRAIEVLPQWLISAMKCLIHWPNGDYSCQSFPKYAGFERDVFKAVVEFFDDEDKRPLVPTHLLGVFKKTVGKKNNCLFTCYLFKCKLTAMRSLQYCCLLIPVKNRELLQMLLKFMVRLMDNHVISLSDELPIKEMLIQSFSRAIFGVTADMDAIRLIYFMMEKFPEYFKSPEGLEFQVEQRLLFLKSCRENKFTVPSEGPIVSFCERVTPQEYKEQSLITSQRSLKDLLNRIVEDRSLSAKDRKKQLKQFGKSYPDIYQAKFPGDNLSTCSQRSEKLRQVMKPLAILKNLR